MEKGGVAAMEAAVMDLKAQGAYSSKMLSFSEVHSRSHQHAHPRTHLSLSLMSVAAYCWADRRDDGVVV